MEDLGEIAENAAKGPNINLTYKLTVTYDHCHTGPDKKAGEGKNDDAKRLLWLQMTWLC